MILVLSIISCELLRPENIRCSTQRVQVKYFNTVIAFRLEILLIYQTESSYYVFNKNFYIPNILLESLKYPLMDHCNPLEDQPCNINPANKQNLYLSRNLHDPLQPA